MFNIDKYLPTLQGGLSDMQKWLGHIYGAVDQTRVLAERETRALEYEFGVVGVADSEKIAPRSLTSLPVIIEKVVTDHAEVDLEQLNQQRAVCKGQYKNIGSNAFFVTLVGVGGQASGRHTLAAGETLPIVCLLSRIVIDPIDGPANLQILAY